MPPLNKARVGGAFLPLVLMGGVNGSPFLLPVFSMLVSSFLFRAIAATTIERSDGLWELKRERNIGYASYGMLH